MHLLWNQGEDASHPFILINHLLKMSEWVNQGVEITS